MKKPRAALYLRQSTFKEESISLELQETACRTYAQQQGYDVVAVEADPGISGRTFKRPGVTKVMDLIERRDADVIVLWKWSRLSRSRLDWAVAADKVETIGGRIESATEPIDVSTSTGRFARGMLTEFAAFESERIGETWKETHARRIRNGLPHHGLPRFGYNYSKAEGYTVDPDAGPVLREMYLRFIRGANIRELGEYAASEGFEKVSGWRIDNTRRMLDRGFGAGYVYHKGELIKGAHEGVISEGEWMAYRARRDARSGRSRAESSDYAYSGLLRCHCGARMVGSLTNKANGVKYQRYICVEGQQKGGHGASVSDRHVADAVLSWLKEIAVEVDANASTVEAQPKAPNLERKKAQLFSEITKNATRLDALTVKYIDGDIPAETYKRLSENLEAEKVALEARSRMLEVNTAVKPAAVIKPLLAGWESAPARLKREALASILSEIRLHDWEGEVVSGSRKGRMGRRPITIHPVWE
jgi:DNA invertase Pin-like site-specific DNA recombinase